MNHNDPSLHILTLPHHLISEEILPKLPIKSLIRFKSVSKSWLSTISSPEFAMIHLKSSSSRLQILIIIASLYAFVDGNLKHETLSLHYNESSYDIEDMDRFALGHRLHPAVQVPSLVGCCNGLVCLNNKHMDMKIQTFFVWNPATRHLRRIDYPDGESEISSYAFHFSYSPSSNEYRIFGAFSSNVDSFAHFYVFSWSTGVWKTFDKLNKRFPKLEIKDVVLIDETVYLFRLPDLIVRFDLVKEEMDEFPPLHWLSAYDEVRILKLRGCLSMLCYSVEKVLDVYMLKQPNDWNSWEKFALDFTNIDWYYGISETGKCLAYHDGQLKVVDPIRGDGTLEFSQKGIDFDFKRKLVLRCEDYIETLISPF